MANNLTVIGEALEAVSKEDVAKTGLVVLGAVAVAGIAVVAHRAITEANTEAHKERMQAMKDNDIKSYESASSVDAASDHGGKKSAFSFSMSDTFKASR